MNERSALELKAERFATEAHREQKRKYTNAPYIEHPARVAEIVRSVPHTEEMLAAAWLHDTVEDCGVKLLTIANGFGIHVAELVGWLTDVSRPEDGNRAKRKELDRAHTARAPRDAQTVKLADLIDNSRDIVENDPKFAVVYLREKVALLEVLGHGDPTLMQIARGLVVKPYGR